jgi:hypothetical protein
MEPVVSYRLTRDKIKPGTVVVQDGTGFTREIVAVDGEDITYRDAVGVGECSLASLRNWRRKHRDFPKSA